MRIKLTAYYFDGNSGRGRYKNNNYDFDKIDAVLEKLETTDAESVVIHLFDGEKEKTFSHSRALTLSLKNPAARDQNKRELLRAIGETDKTEENGWHSVSVRD